MIDIFTHKDVCKLLQDKNIVFLGDSNIRAIYKDFLCLLHYNKFISANVLKQKMEGSCLGDNLNYHGQRSNGRNYREERSASINGTNVSFYFLTRVYDSYVEGVLKMVGRNPPDVIVINSCLWDVTRWGPMGVEDYKSNMKDLMRELKKKAPDCLVIWVTTPPIAQEMKGGFLLQELQFLKYSLRFHVVEANHYARKVVVENGFDVLDTHYHLKHLIHKRSGDGIHWFADTVRFITNLLLTHISLAWDEPLPHRYNSEAMQQNLNTVLDEEASNAPEIEVYDAPEASTSTSQKEKENLNSTQKKTNCEEINANRWTKQTNHNRQTHHAYFSRQQYKNRLKRVKKSKQATYTHHSPPGKFCYNDSEAGYLSKYDYSGIRQSYQDSLSDRTVLLSSPPTSSFSHYDSGYFSSPNPAYSPPENRPYFFDPQNRPISNSFQQYNPMYRPDINFTSDDIEGYFF